MKNTDSVRAVNGEFPNKNSGPLRSDHWAVILGITERRVLALFREKSVPRRKIGDHIYADWQDVWTAFPNVGE